MESTRRQRIKQRLARSQENAESRLARARNQRRARKEKHRSNAKKKKGRAWLDKVLELLSPVFEFALEALLHLVLRSLVLLGKCL